MEKRVDLRHDVGLLQDELTNVVIVFQDKHETEAGVVDISPQGLKVSIHPSGVPLTTPQQNEAVDIFFAAIYLRITCRYIYSMDGEDGSVFMGFYVFDPDDQTRLRILLDKIR